MLFSSFQDTTSDPEQFAQWQPKIAAYRAKLAAGVKSPYCIPEAELPSQAELDKGLDAVAFGERYLSEREKAVTALSGPALAAQIAAGALTSVEVFEAYAKRATIAHQLTNCAMELFVDEGLQRARELDAYLAANKRVVGPLHGVPVSVKEHCDYRGKVTHWSYVGMLENVTPQFAAVLEDLHAQGAVFYVRTSEPQMLMHLCSNNNITGRTRNPWNTALTPGGSSSGEGAIAAMRGSVFGVGSDIGGSIRCPAAFCGVWGLRPTQKRLSNASATAAWMGQVQEAVVPVFGPLARSADDLDLFMRCLVGAEPWKRDPDVLPIPWRRAAEPEPARLRIAVVYDDGVVRPTPPIVRGLKAAVARLQRAGVDVVEWENTSVQPLVEACYSGYTSDGNHLQKRKLALSGEPLVALSQTHLTFGCGDRGLSGVDVQRVCFTRDSGRAAYLAQMNDRGIDFILSPAYVSVASRPETIHYWGYTCLWNILDFPNVVFPTGLAVEPVDAADASFTARNDVEAYEYGLYTGPDDFAGAPISLQLTGRRYADEDVIQAAKVLERIISDGEQE